MSKDLNLCQFIGRLGKDPEMRYTPAGAAVANFSIASSEQWKDKQSGEKQERTEWVRIVAFNRLAEVIGEYLKKGSKIYISGRMQTRKWQDDSGADRYSTEIVANNMQMLDTKGSGGPQYNDSDYPEANRNAPAGGAQAAQAPAQGGQQRPPAQGQGGQQQAPAQGGAFDEFDDDIPF